MFPLIFKSNMLKLNDFFSAYINSLTTQSVLAGEKLVATYSIYT